MTVVSVDPLDSPPCRHPPFSFGAFFIFPTGTKVREADDIGYRTTYTY